MIHMKRKHLNSHVTHSCPFCHLDLATNQLLMSHLLEEHNTSTLDKEHGDKNPVECDFCGKQYKCKSSIINHFRRGCDQNPHVSLILKKVCFLRVYVVNVHLMKSSIRFSCLFLNSQLKQKLCNVVSVISRWKPVVN